MLRLREKGEGEREEGGGDKQLRRRSELSLLGVLGLCPNSGEDRDDDDCEDDCPVH